MYYNVRYARANITVVEGDTINMTFDVEMNGEPFDMSGMQLDMHVRDEEDGTLIRSLSSAGASPELTISTTSFIIDTALAFTEEAVYDFDVQVTDGDDISTIMMGKLYIVKEITITY